MDRSYFIGDTGAFFPSLVSLLLARLGLFFTSSICFEFYLILFLACLHGHGGNTYSFMWTFCLIHRGRQLKAVVCRHVIVEVSGNMLLQMKWQCKSTLCPHHNGIVLTKRHVSTSCLTTLHLTPRKN